VTSPSLARRFAALLADWILCLLAAGLFARPLVDGWAPVLVLILEYTLFVGLFGQTPGMRLLKLTCLDAETQRPVGLYRAFLRGILLALFVPALIMDKDRRGVHDRIAGTTVRSGSLQTVGNK
jgi:uncharacterized RDD family membrane protein YckC